MKDSMHGAPVLIVRNAHRGARVESLLTAVELVPLLDIELIESIMILSQRVWVVVRFDAGWPKVLNVDLANE